MRPHLAEAIDPAASDAKALTVLDRLGEPGEIVEAEQPSGTAAVPPARGNQEWAAILLWASRAWTTRDKWIGTLLYPGGSVLVLAVLAQRMISLARRARPRGRERDDGREQQARAQCADTNAVDTALRVVPGLVLLVPVATDIYRRPLDDDLAIARQQADVDLPSTQIQAGVQHEDGLLEHAPR